MAFNLDNFQELERTAAIIASGTGPKTQEDRAQSPQLIGLRINPQVRALWHLSRPLRTLDTVRVTLCDS